VGDRVTLSAETATVVSRLASQVEEAIRVHRHGAFPVMSSAVMCGQTPALRRRGISWG
jgi:hypothetical protein